MGRKGKGAGMPAVGGIGDENRIIHDVNMSIPQQLGASFQICRCQTTAPRRAVAKPRRRAVLQRN